MDGALERLEDLRESLDKGHMLRLVSSFPEHMDDAWQRGRDFARAVKSPSFSRIVVCGIGGSAIGGDLVRSFLRERLKVPVHVNRGYDVPPSLVGDGFFVFSSYSGNTGETLAAYRSLRQAGAPCVAITSGGELADLCKADNNAVCEVPGGMPPRAAIAYSFFPLLQTIAALGVATVGEDEAQEARDTLATLCQRYKLQGTGENLAAELAYRLQTKFPFVYSCTGLLDAVARRWSTQFNENSKVLAHFGAFPELNHNEIVGWRTDGLSSNDIFVLSLEDREDHALSRKQARIAMEIVEPLCGGVVHVSGMEGGRLTRLLSTMILGDFTSVYLAYLNGVDPTPVENIDFLKQRLREST